MSLTYTELEDAIMAQLEPLRNELGVRTLESYGGQFSPDSFGRTTIIFPAVYVYLAELKNRAVSVLEERRLTVSVFVAARNLRGEKAARRGTAAAVGTYSLLEGVRDKLNRVNLAGGRLQLLREAVFGYSEELGLCVAKADYELEFRV